MARLTIEQKHGKFAMNVPHKLLIDGRMMGIMKDRRVSLEMPMGEYEITIQSMIPFISASQRVALPLRGEVTLVFSDREKWWDVLFVVDIYNEGVDIPEVNTVLFLRPTESLTIFLQQLGRGLRLAEGKECLT